MARAGFVSRLVKPCAVAAFLGLVAACGGGDGGEPVRTVTTVTVSSPTSTPRQGDTVQLTAVARDQFGDVVPGTTATWSTSDARIATVSASGLLLALTPGSVVTTATAGGVAGSVSLLVLGPPAAYFINGVEYAFDYQLDARGRVDNYRISQREGIVYPVGPAGDVNVRECTGSLSGSYRCDGWYVYMTGEAGRLVAVGGSIVETSTTYSYEQLGLAEIKEHSKLSPQHWRDSTSTLSYDDDGRLSEVRTSSLVFDWSPETRNTTATIEVDLQGRLLRAGILTCSSWYGCSAASSTTWTYNLAGFMTSAGTTTYSVDADGWLVSRQQESGTLDTYLITRSGGRVAEEQFTQAEPRTFYGSSRPQRVRYQLGRLPVEPLFVPRALTGLNGADYFGVISSHHR